MDYRRFVTQVVVCVAVLASAAWADTIYVDDDNCPGPGSGTELDPYCSIQTAIDSAVDFDEIVVAPGTYFETIDFLGTAITVRSSDGPEVTIIDGTGNPHFVQCVNGEGPDTVLDGFTVRGGNANGPYPDYDGGGMYINDSSPTVIGCTISWNRAALSGGGVKISNGAPAFVRCIFENNVASGVCYPMAGAVGGKGGAVAGWLGSFTDCLFRANEARDVGCYYSLPCCAFIEECCWLWSWRPGLGEVLSGGATMVNCTITQHSGGYLFDGDNAWLANCIVSENGTTELGSQQIVVVASLVEGGWPGDGNIDADPLFVDPANGDFRLSPSSPCIDAGDNTAVPDGIDTDLDGNPRFVDDPDTVDTGYGDPPIVDMGAYEYQIPCPWDLDGDGNVNVVDLLMVIASWGPCAGCPADFNVDGLVNVVDLLALIANFGPCPGVPCVWDVNGDRVVDNADLQQVLDNFGDCDGCAEDGNGDGMVNGQDAAAVATHFGPCP
jgi:hypothetical protein